MFSIVRTIKLCGVIVFFIYVFVSGRHGKSSYHGEGIKSGGTLRVPETALRQRNPVQTGKNSSKSSPNQ